MEVLDPACGSGNFLYLALRSLLDLEKEVIDFAAVRGLGELTPTVQAGPDAGGWRLTPTPPKLARTALWIGYIQWHHNNGFPYNHSPVLTPLVLYPEGPTPSWDLSDPEDPKEPEWPEAEFHHWQPAVFWEASCCGPTWATNTSMLCFQVYGGRVAGEADVVCYWFEKARENARVRQKQNALACWPLKAIRGGANRRTLQRIKETGDIFLAWSDHPWILDGAAVHISIVGFDDGSEANRQLDGNTVASINANLTSGADLTTARRLKDNLGIAFMGDTKGGPFDIPGSLAKENGRQPKSPQTGAMRRFLKPWVNGRDITDRSRGMWIVDFSNMSLERAALYQLPFEYVNAQVRPTRVSNKRQIYAQNWWLHVEPRPGMREALKDLERYIATPTTAKHRLFTWLTAENYSGSSTDCCCPRR